MGLNRKDGIWVADFPVAREHRRGRKQFGVSLFTALIDPCLDGCNFVVAQAPVVRPRSVAGVSFPGRHPLGEDRFPNGSRPWAGLAIVQHGHWRDVVGMVTP